MNGRRPTKLRDWFLLLLCNLIWASQFVAVKVVQQQMGPLFASTFPIGIATIFLAVTVLWKGSVRIPLKHLLPFVLLGVLGQVTAQLFITWGVRLSLASNAALLALALPVSTAVMAHFLLGERMNPVRWASFALCIAGVLACSGVNWKDLNLRGSQYLLGNLLIFASVNGSAFYNAYSKKMLLHHSPVEVLLYSYFTALALLLPVTLVWEPSGFLGLPVFSGKVWLGLLVLAIFQYFLSMVIFLNVLTRLDATQAGLSNYLIPFFGVVIAWVVLHERLTTFMLIGGVLALGSTLLITVFDPEPSEPMPGEAGKPSEANG
jgi:drug/metabolite transporter (DMT)-like permease